MGEFVCRVADANGRVFSHVEPAGSLAEARQKLVERGLFVYSVETRSSLLGVFSKRRRERQIGGSDFLILNQQFNTLIKAGLPILRALDLLADRATSPKLRPVLSKVRDRVREGKSLSEAISEAGVFSKVYATAILAGEKSGNLSGVLDYYIAYQRVSTGVKKKILATLVYPSSPDHRRDHHRHVSRHLRDPQICRLISRPECGTARAHAVSHRAHGRLPLRRDRRLRARISCEPLAFFFGRGRKKVARHLTA